MQAEKFAGINPYQFGANNPVMFNDPMGDLSQSDWNDFMNRLGSGNNLNGFGDYGGSYNGGGGGGFTPFTSNDQAFGWGVGNMNASGGWGSQPGWAKSFGEALTNYSKRPDGGSTENRIQGYNYVNASFSGAFALKSYWGDQRFDSETGQDYYFAGFGDIFDYSGMQAGFALHQESLSSKLLNGFQTGLDVVGLVPGFEFADGINALIYTARGDYVNAGFSTAAMVPFAGIAAIGGKWANKAHIVYHAVDKSGAVKYVGITSRDLIIREAEHKTKDVFKGLDFFEIGRTTNRLDARILEQTLINVNGLPNLINKINSISPSKWYLYGIK